MKTAVMESRQTVLYLGSDPELLEQLEDALADSGLRLKLQPEREGELAQLVPPNSGYRLFVVECEAGDVGRVEFMRRLQARYPEVPTLIVHSPAGNGMIPASLPGFGKETCLLTSPVPDERLRQAIQDLLADGP